jgi:hypothetical protein
MEHAINQSLGFEIYLKWLFHMFTIFISIRKVS